MHSIYFIQIALQPRHFADYSCESDTTQRASKHFYEGTKPDSTRPTTHQTRIRGTKHSCEGLFTFSAFDFNHSLTDERKLAKVDLTSNWKLRWRQIKLHTSRATPTKKPQNEHNQERDNTSLIVAQRRRFELSRWRSKASRATSNRRKKIIKEFTKQSTNLYTEKYIL